MAKKRKTFVVAVTITVPHWCSAAQARRAVKDQINDGYFEYFLEGPEYQDGRVKATSVRPLSAAKSEA